MSIIPTGPARLFVTNASGEQQEIGVIVSGNISVGGSVFPPFASGDGPEEIHIASGSIGPIPPFVVSGAIGSGQIGVFSLGSGLISPALRTRICACCKQHYNFSIPGQVEVYDDLTRRREQSHFYCHECTGYTKEKGIITRKDLILARAGLLPETPIPILLDFLEDHNFSEEDIAYMRRFLK